MNSKLKKLMEESGTHKYISEECQNRIEFVVALVVEECAQICMSQADRRNIRNAFGLPVESNVKYPGPEARNSIESQYNREINIPKHD
jgi:hypothetical protein